MSTEKQTLSYEAVVVGSGASGYHAAIRLAECGRKIAIVTEGVMWGTSRNTGSDKQTYYKLGLGGSAADSVRDMAKDLFGCGCVDGDNALCEAALSTRCFFNLCELGVAFPCNRYGEYVGYKTDHDPRARATSVGPLTSKFMTEALQKKAEALGIPVLDGFCAVEVLRDENGVLGLLCLVRQTGEFRLIRCPDVVLATGGPAGIYADSVYPLGHNGATGLALEAGVPLQNMTEWQFGLASVAPRWNVSGTYMQVLPRLISVGDDGEEREFLADYFADAYEGLTMLFLKGYQWPFDSRKVQEGSSVIDLLVWRECVLKKRRVYLDYRCNPFGLKELDFSRLGKEAYEYLDKAQACFGTPLERLYHMNQPAVDLYAGFGVDLSREPLEIALCAQHNNGGISVDAFWQTELPGLFAVGECAGTHGITRPGGSALNAGQVGSLRAAQYINAYPRPLPDEDAFDRVARLALARHQSLCGALLSHEANVQEQMANAARDMSNSAAAIREKEAMQALSDKVKEKLASFAEEVGVKGPEELYLAYRLRDVLLVQQAVLCACIDYIQVLGKTRGSALYRDEKGTLRPGLEELFRFIPSASEGCDMIQTVRYAPDGCHAAWRPVRPLPPEGDVFETVWRTYRENKNVY